MKLYATTVTGNKSRCIISDAREEDLDTIASAWPFACDWGVIMDEVEVCSLRLSTNSIAMYARIARHFRHVFWHYGHGPTEDLLQHVVANPESMVQGLKFCKVGGDQIELLSTVMWQSAAIRSLTIELLDCPMPQVNDFVERLCQCRALKKIAFRISCQITAEAVVRNIVSLIECHNLESISHEFRHTGHEFRLMSDAELNSRKVEWTQRILDAIEGNSNLNKLNLHHRIDRLNRDADIRSFFDNSRIRAIVGSRTDRLIILKMSQFLTTNCPLSLALFGKMICRLGACRTVSKRTRNISMLFGLLTENSGSVVKLFEDANDETANMPDSMRI